MYYVFLVIFGILGAWLRYAISLWVHMDFPMATLIVNIAGSFLLAFLTSLLSAFAFMPKKLVSAIGTGFVGSFTTFSTFALDSTKLLYLTDYIGAAAYILASLFGGLLACLLGYWTSRFMLRAEGEG